MYFQNPMDNAPFDLNGPAADSQVDALPSAHWPYRARYPAAAAAPPNTFPVPFESIYRPVYAPTADAFRRLSTDEIELFERNVTKTIILLTASFTPRTLVDKERTGRCV